jgi:hypothetical protein
MATSLKRPVTIRVSTRALLIVSLQALASAQAGWVLVPSPSPNGNGILTSVASVPGSTLAWSVGTYNADYHDWTLIERWDGTSWQVVPSPNPAGSNHNILRGVTALAPDDAWAVGSYKPAGGGTRTLVLHWDGVVWSLVPSVDPSTYSELWSISAESKNSVWAVGHHYAAVGQQAPIEHWDGIRWRAVKGPALGNAYHLLKSVTVVRNAVPIQRPQVLAAGTIYGSDGVPSALVTRWDWSTLQWSLIPTPDASSNENFFVGIDGSHGGDVWSVGTFSTPTDLYLPLAEHWDGSTWSVVQVPHISSSLTSLSSVATINTSSAWAVGYYYNGLSARLTLAEHWDGTAWTLVPTPNPAGTGPHEFNSLEAIAHAPGVGLWVVGYWQHPFSPPQTLICFL